MKIIAVTASQKLYDLDFYKSILRKLSNAHPNAIIRSVGGNQDARELNEFIDALGHEIEFWKGNGKWGNYAPEIRNKEMLRGWKIDPDRCAKPFRDPETDWPLPSEVHPPADLLLVFWDGKTSSNTHVIVRQALALAHPILIYKEIWSRPKRKPAKFKHVERITNDPQMKNRLGKPTIIHIEKKTQEAA